MLLHGFTGSAASWDGVAAGLDGPALAAYLPGHDPRVPATAPFEAAVDALAAALRGAFPGPPVLCGYSLGARVALGVLARHPGAARRAVLVGAHPGLADPAERAARAAEDAARARRLREDGLAAFLADWERHPLFATQAALPAAVRARQRALRAAHDAEGLAGALATLGLAAMPDYGPALPGIDVPVALVAGEHDPKFRALAGRMAGLLPRATLHVVPGAGHNVPLEDPAALAAILVRA